MTGYQIAGDDTHLGDWHYLRQGWATLTPLQLDTTNHQYLEELRSLAGR